MALDRNALCAGTRPEITDYRVLMTAADGFDGYEILDYKGMVWGISVRAKDMGQDCAMGCKQMVGGELSSYSQLGDESRQRAIEKMVQMAQRMNANAIINVTYQLSDANQGASQVVVNGTACYIKPVTNYVPEGAIGNILAEIHDRLTERANR
jgi:uncharacterized protein YbjQ (UPF0145 family)